jgi:UV damage endonuclease UvdE
MTAFDPKVQRAGFACKIQQSHDVPIKYLNTSTTTIKWLSAQPKHKAEQRLWDLTKQNILALYHQIEWVGTLPRHQRMFRITSDLLPAYTHSDWLAFYFQPDMTTWLERNLMECGELARQLDVRLSFHPGQFCVLASENPGVVDNSIAEFEYHADLARYMGYGKTFQDFKINVHIGGKRGPDGIKEAVRSLSREARNCLTIENAEYTWGLDASLQLVDTCALVLDIHHHWIATGEYIEATDPRVTQIIDSWRGQRPVIHYSVSREDCLVDHDASTMPDFKQLKALGFTSTKLRAHSDYYWNTACNAWARSHNSWADIMCEGKQKNLASLKFCQETLAGTTQVG